MATIIKTTDDVSGLSSDLSYWLYNGMDCMLTHEINGELQKLLDPVTRRTYEFSKSLQAPVMDMTLRGVKMDMRKIKPLSENIKVTIDKLETIIYKLVHEGVGWKDFNNWNSTTQLQKLFFTIMRAPETTKGYGDNKKLSLDRDALESLKKYYTLRPIINLVLELRDYSKKYQWLTTNNDQQGRMKTNLKIGGTVTGRFASEKSVFGDGGNMQNADKALKEVFIPDEGYKLGNCDLEQADSRNFGAMIYNTFYESHGAEAAGKYLDACESGDLHTQVAMMSFPDLPWGTVENKRDIADLLFYREKTYRDACKMLGHGTNFLGTPNTMASNTHIPVKNVKLFQGVYMAGFPLIPAYHKWVENEINTKGYITTLMGRKRHFFGRKGDAKRIRDAVSFAPQSMTADEINTGLLRVWRKYPMVQFLMQVHDSLLFQFPEHMEEELMPLILKELTIEMTLKGGRKFFVPTDAQTGWNWGNHHKDKNPNGMMNWKPNSQRQFIIN